MFEDLPLKSLGDLSVSCSIQFNMQLSRIVFHSKCSNQVGAIEIQYHTVERGLEANDVRNSVSIMTSRSQCVDYGSERFSITSLHFVQWVVTGQFMTMEYNRIYNIAYLASGNQYSIHAVYSI